MIDCIKHRTINGLSVIIDIDEFNSLAPKCNILGSPYTFCVHWILGGVANWIEETNYKGGFSYFFESGHQSQGESNNIMNSIFRIPKLRETMRYVQHGFVDKKRSPPVQAADLLARQWYTDLRHKVEGKKRRKDLENLLGHPHKTLHIRPEYIRQLAEAWGKEEGQLYT